MEQPNKFIVQDGPDQAELDYDGYIWKTDNNNFAGKLNMITKDFHYRPEMGDRMYALYLHLKNNIPGLVVIEMPDIDDLDPDMVY